MYMHDALCCQAPDTKLKINRLKNENRQLFFLDGLISEYGLGLKQACSGVALRAAVAINIRAIALVSS